MRNTISGLHIFVENRKGKINNFTYLFNLMSKLEIVCF